MGKPLSIREISQVTGVTAHTLRYYERVGLIFDVPRNESGHRAYTEGYVRWVTFLRKMHETGMPIRTMRRFARLMQQGDDALRERRELLEAHRREMTTQLEVLTTALALIDKKLRLYRREERKLRARSRRATTALSASRGRRLTSSAL